MDLDGIIFKLFFTPWVRVLMEYPAIAAMSFQTPLVLSGIEGIRPDGGSWLGLQPAVRSTSDAVLGSLYRHSQRSCRPQPLGSRREAAPCEDTRQDR